MTPVSLQESATMQIAFGARSDTGRARENNEDSFALAPELNLFVLSDGMGGLAAGEVASKLASATVIAHCREAAVRPHTIAASKSLSPKSLGLCSARYLRRCSSPIAPPQLSQTSPSPCLRQWFG